MAIIDGRTSFLPDALTYPFLILGLLANLQGTFVPATDALIGAVAGFLIFWGIGAAYFRLKEVDGLGLGDAKLLAGIGAWLGWFTLPLVVLIASLLGLGLLLISKLRGTELTSQTAIPFGPFLAIGAALAMLGLVSGILP